MKLMNPRRAAAVGALIGSLGAGYAISCFSLRVHASPGSERPQLIALPDAAARSADVQSARVQSAGLQNSAVQNHDPAVRWVKVTASRYHFDPPLIEVAQDDVVKIELRTEDIAHSLTIDAYRIAKRVSPQQPITFEFRADQPGTFPYYCNLLLDDGCRQMRGQLVVKPKNR